MTQSATSITGADGSLPKRTPRDLHRGAPVPPVSPPAIELLQAVLDGLQRLDCERDGRGV